MRTLLAVLANVERETATSARWLQGLPERLDDLPPKWSDDLETLRRQVGAAHYAAERLLRRARQVSKHR